MSNSFKVNHAVYKEYVKKVSDSGQEGWAAKRPVTAHAHRGVLIDAPADEVFDPFRAFDWEDRRLDGCAILPYRAPGSPPEPEDITSVQVLGSTREIGAIRHITFPNGCILPETMVALDLVQRTCSWDSSAVYGGPSSPFTREDNDWRYHFSNYLASLSVRDAGAGRSYVEFKGQVTVEFEDQAAVRASLEEIYAFFLTNLKARMELPGRRERQPKPAGPDGTVFENIYLRSQRAARAALALEAGTAADPDH